MNVFRNVKLKLYYGTIMTYRIMIMREMERQMFKMKIHNL